MCSGVSAVEGLPPVKSQSVYPSVFPLVCPAVSFGLIVSLLSYSVHGMPRMWCVDQCCRTRPGSGLARLPCHWNSDAVPGRSWDGVNNLLKDT